MWIIPALSFGPNRWSVVTIENVSSTPRTVSVQAWDEEGEPMDLPPEMLLAPRQKTELRVEKPGFPHRQTCWLRISTELLSPVDAALLIGAAVEILKGNVMERFRRDFAIPSGKGVAFVPEYRARGEVLYFLNTTNESIEASFCWSDRSPRCPPGRTSRYVLKPRQAIRVMPGRGKGNYFVVSWPLNRIAALVLLLNGSGEPHEFSSESAIRFGNAAE